MPRQYANGHALKADRCRVFQHAVGRFYGIFIANEKMRENTVFYLFDEERYNQGHSGHLLLEVLTRRCPIILFKCFIKIAAVAVTQHGSDFFVGESRSFHQHYRTLHPQPEENFGKGISCLILQKIRDIGGVIGKMLPNR